MVMARQRATGLAVADAAWLLGGRRGGGLQRGGVEGAGVVKRGEDKALLHHHVLQFSVFLLLPANKTVGVSLVLVL